MSDKSFAFKGNVPTSITLAPAADKIPPTGVPQTGSLPLTVQNISQRQKTARLTILAEGATDPKWFSFAGAPATSPRERDLDFEAGATQTVTVQVVVPPKAAAADAVFKVRMSAEQNTDNDNTDSPAVSFKVSPTPPGTTPPPPPFPWWIVAVIAAVLVCGGGAAYYFWPAPSPQAAQITVPNVVGQQATDALTKLSGLEFVVSAKTTSDRSKADNVIVDQDPKAGASLPKQSPVSITINVFGTSPCSRIPGGCVFHNFGEVEKFKGLLAVQKQTPK